MHTDCQRGVKGFTDCIQTASVGFQKYCSTWRAQINAKCTGAAQCCVTASCDCFFANHVCLLVPPTHLMSFMHAPGSTMGISTDTMSAPGSTMNAQGKTVRAPGSTMSAPGSTMGAPGILMSVSGYTWQHWHNEFSSIDRKMVTMVGGPGHCG